MYIESKIIATDLISNNSISSYRILFLFDSSDSLPLQRRISNLIDEEMLFDYVCQFSISRIYINI